MKQSNTLRRLENILYEAVNNGKNDQNSALVLMEAMNFDSEPQNIVHFYALLLNAKEDAKKINIPKIEGYIQVLEELNAIFITSPIWGSQWVTFANHIKSKYILTTLDALANYLHSQEPKIFIEQDFLLELNSELEELLNKILNSDLSKELRRYLSVRIENILKAIRIYTIDGTEGLERATKSLLNDLLLTEHKLKEEDKQNPIYKTFQASVISLSMFFTPSAYDIVGLVPDLYEFWIPNFQDRVAHKETIAKILSEESNIQEVFKKAPDIFKQETNKSISGKEQKLITPAKEDVIN